MTAYFSVKGAQPQRPRMASQTAERWSERPIFALYLAYFVVLAFAAGFSKQGGDVVVVVVVGLHFVAGAGVALLDPPEDARSGGLLEKFNASSNARYRQPAPWSYVTVAADSVLVAALVLGGVAVHHRGTDEYGDFFWPAFALALLGNVGCALERRNSLSRAALEGADETEKVAMASLL